jgi:hypothetical protein
MPRMSTRMLWCYTSRRRLFARQLPGCIVEPDLDTQCQWEFEPWDRVDDGASPNYPEFSFVIEKMLQDPLETNYDCPRQDPGCACLGVTVGVSHRNCHYRTFVPSGRKQVSFCGFTSTSIKERKKKQAR